MRCMMRRYMRGGGLMARRMCGCVRGINEM